MIVPLWLLCGLVCSCAVGWLVAKVHVSGHSPVGLVSLGVGVLLGAVLRQLATTLRFAGSRILLASAVLVAIATVLSEHAWLYQDFCREWNQSREKSAVVAMFRPESPPSPREYFTREWRPALWLADAALIVAGAVGMAYFRRPKKPLDSAS